MKKGVLNAKSAKLIRFLCDAHKINKQISQTRPSPRIRIVRH